MNRDQAETLRLVVGQELKGKQSQDANERACRVISITGGKGGVGKTNTAVNLSLALCEAGAKVLMLDADLGLANVDVILGINPQFTLEHVIKRELQLKEILVEGPLGLKILPGGTGIAALANLSPIDVVRLLEDLAELESQFDYILIDTAAGIGQQVVRFTLHADDIVLVYTPEPTSMLDAYGLMKTLKANHYQGRMHLLANMITKPGEADQVYKALSQVAEQFLDSKLNLLGSLPQDDEIVISIKKQQPFFLRRPQSPAARELRQVALHFINGTKRKSVKPVGNFFQRIVSSIR